MQALVAALRTAKRACLHSPQDPRRWSELGRVHAIFADYTEALKCFTKALRLDPTHVDAWHNLGTAFKKVGLSQDALTAFQRALRLDETRADTYLNLGNLLIEDDQLENAVRCFERAAAYDPALAPARSRLAEQLSVLGKTSEAQSLFHQAVAIDPDHVQGWLGLGQTLEDTGDAENAVACYQNVLRRYPTHPFALGQMLAVMRETATDELLSVANRCMTDDTAEQEARALIGYGLAKYYDKRKCYPEAAQAGVAANAARRRVAGPLDRDELVRRVEGIISTYDADFFASRGRFGLGADQPVFIVGLPRSGTTLCEQILASHPLVHGAGELVELARVAGIAAEIPWQAAGHLTEATSVSLGMRYLRVLRNDVPKGIRRICDKAPLNFFQLALAALLCPHARVIHCTRNAKDNALSIWMENFKPDQCYATDFGDLAFYRAQYERVMEHWRRVLPLEILEVSYEQTVRDVANQARRLTDFLDVPWNEACLHFHNNPRSVQTPSRWQVRQPIYSRSVDRWRHYEQLLEELTC